MYRDTNMWGNVDEHVDCWVVHCGNDHLYWSCFWHTRVFPADVGSGPRARWALSRSSTVTLVTVGGSRVSRACHSGASAQTNAWERLADARGQGCCCYDAMATARWEACEELNEFSPQLKWSSRRQSAQDTERAAQGLSADRTSSLHPPPPMEAHGQVPPLAPQLALSWRPGRFLTHLDDVAARRQRQRHPVRPPQPTATEEGLFLIPF